MSLTVISGTSDTLVFPFMDAVVVWGNMLGGVQCWQNSIPRGEPCDPGEDARGRREAGNACQCSLPKVCVSMHFSTL